MLDPLINKGANVNAVDNNGRTPLHDAVSMGHWYIVDLIEKGADINAMNNDGRTPLQDAARAGSRNTVVLLIKECIGYKAGTASRFITDLTDLLYEDNIINTLLSVALNVNLISGGELRRNIRRMLIQYGRNLKDEAKSNENLAAASFIRHYSSLVSWNICLKVVSRLNDSRFHSLEESVKWLGVFNNVDRLSKESNTAPEATTSNLDEETEESISVPQPLAELSHVKRFLVSSHAFALLRENLHRFLNPTFQTRLMGLVDEYRIGNESGFCSYNNLRGLTAELLDVNPSCIRWSKCDRTSWSDVLKWKFEGWTREKWDWWPFKPPQQRLGLGEVRLHWTCVSATIETIL